MMNAHLQYSAATMYQKDLLARSARRRLARSMRGQARLADEEAAARPTAASAPAQAPAGPKPAPAAVRACRTAGQH